MNLTLERKLPIILFFVFLMLTIIGLVFYQNTVSLQDAITWEQQGQTALMLLDNTMTSVLDAETDMRGFVRTGNTTYAERYERNKRLANANIDQYRSAVGAPGQQAQMIGNVEAALAGYWELSDRMIERRKEIGPEAAFEESRLFESKTAIDRVRGSIENLRDAELSDIRGNRASLETKLRWTIYVLIIASIAGVLSLAVANLLVWTEGRRRARAESDLREANRGLEKKVENRTEELKRANEEMKEIAAERERLFADEMAARQEAEIANRLRDEFMATVSHELRTPLNSILGWARLLRAGDLDEPHSQKAITTIIKNAETQNRLIEDLLDVARLISGKLQLDMDRVNIAELVEDTIDSQRPAAAAKNIQIRNRFEEVTPPLIVNGDRDRLEQVFSNLLTNAIKFTPADGSVEVWADVKGSEIEIAVKDNGVGISGQFLPLVFERFRQDLSAEGRNGGLGLGLAIVRNLVEMHGGTVKAVSEGENLGATFVVRLPVELSQQPADQQLLSV